ncbi:MauE/DoxX family redox-associated membrane protein [Bacillus subtilis]|uniref:MauE/DoxX family redox-associated membrane protein n=2 Tax=Bacillus subtilis TaxID=1423 RepID=UPI00397BF671
MIFKMSASLIIKVFYVIIGVIFLKSSLSKIKRPMNFYYAIMDYKIITKKRIADLVVPFLVSLEFLLACLLITAASVSSLIIGISIQLFYVFLILSNINKEFKNNCGCFGFNTPRVPTLKHFSMNIFLLISIIILYGLQERI